MSEFDVLSAAAGGMDAQRRVLDIEARNVAAAQVSEKGDFRRLVPHFETDGPEETVRFTGVSEEPANGADALSEMIAVLGAQRAYEANASLFDLGKRLAERTIDVGRS